MFRMNKFTIFLFLVFVILFTCSMKSFKNEANLMQNEKDTLNKNKCIGKLEENDSLRNPFHFAYLTDLSFVEIGNLILSDSVAPTDNKITFILLDTISKCNENELSFFLKVFENIMNKSDGALSEVVGQYTLQFINKRPEIFARHIGNSSKETIQNWAKFSIYELYYNCPADSLVFCSKELTAKLKEISNNDGLLFFEESLLHYAEKE